MCPVFSDPTSPELDASRRLRPSPSGRMLLCRRTRYDLSSRHPRQIADITQVIGTYLVQLLTSPPPPTTLAPEMLIAVLNAIIDIYADEGREYDRPVFVAGQFLQGLTGVVGRVRNDVSGSALLFWGLC
jgi:hypothetical protein